VIFYFLSDPVGFSGIAPEVSAHYKGVRIWPSLREIWELFKLIWKKIVFTGNRENLK